MVPVVGRIRHTVGEVDCMFFLFGTQGLRPACWDAMPIHAAAECGATAVMQGLDLLGGLPRLASQELKT